MIIEKTILDTIVDYDTDTVKIIVPFNNSNETYKYTKRCIEFNFHCIDKNKDKDKKFVNILNETNDFTEIDSYVNKIHDNFKHYVYYDYMDKKYNIVANENNDLEKSKESFRSLFMYAHAKYTYNNNYLSWVNGYHLYNYDDVTVGVTNIE